MSEIISRNLDVTFSPDDDGWYCTEYPSGRTTAVYESRSAAVAAARDGRFDDEADS